MVVGSFWNIAKDGEKMEMTVPKRQNISCHNCDRRSFPVPSSFVMKDDVEAFSSVVEK